VDDRHRRDALVRALRAVYYRPVDPIEVVVEIPRGSRNKYEFDQARGVFVLDRVLFSSVHYPTDYGYVVETLAEDADPLDALVIIDEPTFAGCHVLMRPIGMLEMRDEKGPDEKVLGVAVGDPHYGDIHGLDDIGSHWLREIENFFQTYKTLEDKPTEVVGWHDTAAAERAIHAARARFAQPR
jgi:inorganic pyrophosphatase